MADADTVRLLCFCMGAVADVTYSDDEFGSDYEAEYDDADEGESEQQLLVYHHEAAAHVTAVLKEPELTSDQSAQTPTDLDSYVSEESVACIPSDDVGPQERGELPVAETDTDGDSRPDTSKGTAASSRDAKADAPEAERIQHVPSVSLEEPSDASTTEEANSQDEIEASASQPPKMLRQLAKPASSRSLSVPAVPTASLVDPSLLVPSNLRSTSVPVVPSNEIMGIHRQNSGRFRIETVSRTNARHKSIVRLPSVEEMIGQSDVMEEEGKSDDEDSDGNSESDDATDSSPPSPLSNRSTSPRARSSSLQKTLPPKISPVLRAKSQPFMVRLPSVVEVTAEEILYIESTRNGDIETKSNGKGENSDFSDETTQEETGNEAKTADAVQSTSPSLTDQQAELKAPEPAKDPVPSAAVDPLDSVDSVEMELQPNPVSVSSESPEQIEEPDDEYEDDYDDQRPSDTTVDTTGNGNTTGTQQELLDDDEFDDFKRADETNYNDDEYEGEGDNYADDYADGQFEEESRRETELLLRETQLLIQKQHDDAIDRVLLTSFKSESPDIPDQSEPPEPATSTYFVPAALAEAKVVEEELSQLTAAPESTATAATSFEDQYGGDDEFTTADEDSEFDQYASDSSEAEDDDPGEYMRELNNLLSEHKPPEDVQPSESVSESEAGESSAKSGEPQVTNSAETDAQVDTSSSEATLAGISESAGLLQPTAIECISSTDTPDLEPVVLVERVPSASESLPPPTAPSDSSQEPGQVEESKASINRSSSGTKSLQDTKKKPSAALNSSSATTTTTTTAQQKPARSVSTRPSRPAAAAAPGATNTPRASRPIAPPAAAERRKVEMAESVLKRERPRELRQKTQRVGGQSSSSSALSNTSPSPRAAQAKPDGHKAPEAETELVVLKATPSEPIVAPAEMISPPGSPGREARRSPEKIAPYTPRVYVEEYEPPPSKAPVFQQKRVMRPKVEDARRKLLPVKSPLNLRIDLPSMDKTKRNWLFLNLFRHGDDVSKYEPFVPQLVSPGLPQSAGRPTRPDSALQQTYASSQAQAITAYGKGSRNGRRLVQPPDPALRERERNWAPIKPHESAIPTYDSILDKFCTTVTSPVIQRQIYQTRYDDLSPQLAYVLEKRVEKQWKAGEAAEAFGAASFSYKADVVHSPSSVSSAIDKKSP